MSETAEDTITELVRRHFPNVQGIYLFGSHGTEQARPESDIDIALLLPPAEAKQAGDLRASTCATQLTLALRKEVDLVNARLASTVLQKEIFGGNRLIDCADRHAVDEFEMLTLSYYQELNEERREILEQFRQTGRAYNV